MKTVLKPNDSKLTEHTIVRDISSEGQLVQVSDYIACTWIIGNFRHFP